VLALLGWMTLQTNLLGWFLLLSGLVYALGVLVVVGIKHIPFWNPQSGGELSTEEKSDRSFWFIVPGMAASFFVPPIEYLFVPAILPRGTAMQLLGSGLVLLGAILFVWARRMIRAGYSGHLAVTTAQTLVQKGPYRMIRHPSYLSFLLMGLGLCLGYSSLFGLVTIPILFLPGIIYRIQVEEKLLAQHFKGQFEQYAARTSRLIPRIW
jgi:protein-S-isoprenylcysteine O-methyltransferase Ste14